jgi:hypothetical protein
VTATAVSTGGGVTQAPSWQVCAAPQGVPARAPAQSPLAPHQAALVLGSMQAPAQAIVSPAHEGELVEEVPEVQAAEARSATPRQIVR